jgi:predicted PurR-regulated permease PerM
MNAASPAPTSSQFPAAPYLLSAGQFRNNEFRNNPFSNNPFSNKACQSIMSDRPPPRADYPLVDPSSALATFAVGVIVVAALYFAREIFVPLALAILLSFALGPLVLLLRRWYFGRIPSVIAAVLLAFLVIFGVGSIIGSQLAHLAENLPAYQSNIKDKIDSLRGSATGSGIVGRASSMLRSFSSEIARTTPPADSKPAPPANQANQVSHAAKPPQPVPVEVHQPDPTALQIIQTIVGPLVQPLATTGIVIVFVVFFLLQREDIRDRFIRLAGAHDLQRTTEGLDDAARRLSRYLLAQTALNTSFGVLIGIGLWCIGVPNPLLWGVVAMLLRFVPYIGPVIAAIFPAALALAVDPGWSMLLWTGALFMVVEPVMGQVVEPFVYGHSTGLSAVAVVLAAAFWTWLWGPVGLLLSTPLTLCLVVLGRYVERLKFLDIILGNRPALTPQENFYQRMLANDPDEAARQAEDILKDKSLTEYYDEVAIGGLALAQLDVNRGVLEHQRRARIREAVLGVIDDLSDHVDETPGSPSTEEIPQPGTRKIVLCVAGRGSLDEAAAAMLGQLLGSRGIAARLVPSVAVSAENLFRLDVADVATVCLSYLEPGRFTNARYLVRRLRRGLPTVRIFVGFWTLGDDEGRQVEALHETGADLVVTSLGQAVEQVAAEIANPGRSTPPVHADARLMPA